MTFRYVEKFMHGFSKICLEAWGWHPLQLHLTFISDVKERQERKLVSPKGHSLSSVRPYMADIIFILVHFSHHMKLFCSAQRANVWSKIFTKCINMDFYLNWDQQNLFKWTNHIIYPLKRWHQNHIQTPEEHKIHLSI